MALQTKFLKKPVDIVEEWNDEARINFLFSAFPATYTSNPTHWQSKLDFWTNLITELVGSYNGVCVTYDQILDLVKRNGRQPLGLDTVWKTMIEQKTLTSSAEYLKNLNMNSTWVGWGFNILVRKPSIWITGKVLSPVKSKPPNVSYICPKFLPEKCAKVKAVLCNCDAVCELDDSMVVIKYETALEKLKDTVPGTKCLEIIWKTLISEKQIEVFDIHSDESEMADPHGGEKYIKVCKSSRVVRPVDEIDRGIVHLLCTKATLEKEIQGIYSKQKLLLTEAKQNLKQGQRVLAKHALRQKQQAAKSLNVKEECLSKIEHLLQSINQSKMDKLTLDSYKAGLSAYNATKKEYNLTLENVEATMDEVSDMLAEQDEISSLLATPVNSDELGDDAYEEELQTIMEGEKEDQVLQDAVLKMEGLTISKAEIKEKQTSENDLVEKSPRKTNTKLKTLEE